MKNDKKKQAKAAMMQKNEIIKSIAYEAVYDGGIIKTGMFSYSKAYRIEDSSYEDIKNVTSEEISERFERLICKVSEDFSFQFLIHNSLVSKRSFLERIELKKTGKESQVASRIDLYNRMIRDNSEIGHNNVKKTRYFVLSTEADTADEARDKFSESEDEISELFNDVCHMRITPLPTLELLRLIYGMYNPNPSHKKGRKTIEDDGFVTLESIRRRGKTTKELIMPDSADTANIDYLVLNKNTYVRCFFITTIPEKVSSNLISDITNISSNMIFSCTYEPFDTEIARQVLEQKVERNTKVTHSYVRDTIRDRKLKTTRRHEEMIKSSEDDYFYKAAYERLSDDGALFLTTFTIALFADDLDTLNRDTTLLHISTSKFACQVKPLDTLQMEGLSSALPLCASRINCARVFDSKKLSMMPPLCLQELLLKDGVFCGLNTINDNLVLLNRKNNPRLAGFIAGTEHSGKTYQCKREVLNALMSTDDEIFIISDSDEYDYFTLKLGGTICSDIFTNPLQVPEGYGLDNSDKFSKCLFLEAIAEECLLTLQKEYETEDVGNEVFRFYDTLMTMKERNSGSIFMYMSAQKEEFPLLSEVCRYLYDYEQAHMHLLNFPERLKLIKTDTPLEMLMILEHLYVRRGERTRWIFADSVDDMFSSDFSAGFFKDYIDKTNARGDIFTCVIQSSAKVFSESASAYRLSDMINSFGYQKLLNQGAKEREKYTQILNIPSALVNYITSAELGKGIILTPASGLAFDDNFLSDDENDCSNRFYEIFKA